MNRDDVKTYDLPEAPGVYFFLGPTGKGSNTREERTILYVGKAGSLRDRVRSYFSSDLGKSRSPAIVGMIEKAESLAWDTCESVLEALILEANLIKKYQPPYNVDQKDNKSFNYLVITEEDFPRIIVVRGRDLLREGSHEYRVRATYGPYPQGGSLKEALKIVRKIFPFRDTCTPQSGKPCFNRQIGLCPGVCSGEIDQKEYARIVRNISDIFSGKMPSLRKRLEKEMRGAVKKEHFEEAQILKRQIHALTHIHDVSLIKEDRRVSSGGSFRIEAYDVAHTGGSETVGVMTVVIDGEADKQSYRKFKIQSATNNDIAALSEMLDRRLAHTEWPLPRLIAVDGSVAQIRTAERILEKAGARIPVVGVVKDEFHRPRSLKGDAALIKLHEKAILLANNEAHRYAIGWHRRRHTKRLTM